MIAAVDHAPEEFEVQTWAAEVKDAELRETAEDIVREAGNKAVDAYPSGEKSEPVRILLGRTPEDQLPDTPDKDPLSGIRGFARSFDTIEITYAPVNGWEEHLRGTVAHEYAHTVWIEQRADIHQEGAGGRIFWLRRFPRTGSTSCSRHSRRTSASRCIRALTRHTGITFPGNRLQEKTAGG
ncbi:MAG: hypothetical protein ABEI97_05150, partial [Candidatus Nanohaloarchaea archaeon]